jgi:hypothetical protein
MRPFRSRVLTAVVMAILCLGLLGTVAFADEVPTTNLSVDPAPSLSYGIATSFPEDPWGLPTLGFPEDPWPDL